MDPEHHFMFYVTFRMIFVGITVFPRGILPVRLYFISCAWKLTGGTGFILSLIMGTSMALDRSPESLSTRTYDSACSYTLSPVTGGGSNDETILLGYRIMGVGRNFSRGGL